MTHAGARAMARLAGLFRGGRAAEQGDVDAERLERARSAVRQWKQRADEAAAQTRALRERATALAARLREARRRLAAARRERPSVTVVQQVFAHRLRTLRARVAARSLEGREEQLLGVSAPYRAALTASADALAGLATCVEIDGLHWWTPVERGRRSASGGGVERLPFRGILQTREVVGGGIMLDIGANVGRMAIPRVVLGDVIAAYCAEPDPVTFACLARNVVDNGLRGLVLPDQIAIGDANGAVKLLRTGASGNFHVVLRSSPGADVVEVVCCTLDTWVESLQIDLDAVTFVKVDVEGFERRVLAGARRVLDRRHIAWQIEVKPSGLRAVGDEPGALYADLQRAFSHFIDLNRSAEGERVRPVADLPDALAYIEPDRKTDILVFSVPDHSV